MTCRVSFLASKTPLTKEYQAQKDGSILKNSYPNVYEVTSHEEFCTALSDLTTKMRAHAAKGHCMVKGELTRPLVNESRAGTTNPNGHTSWLLFDLDGVSFKTPNEFMAAMDFANVSYIVQYSASHHIFDKLLRCHILVFLDKPCAAAMLKQHLIAWNFSVPALKTSLTLTRTGTSLRYGLDITTCQNDKLIYIAPPILKGVTDPLKGKQRIDYIKKETEYLTLPASPSIALNQMEVGAHINTLREAASLPARKNVFKEKKGITYLSKPGECAVTDIKEDRGFVYFNLNGGDSWAYYHPSSNPDYIHNFKGEPSYLTKELLPEYWAQVSKATGNTAPPPPQANAQGITHLAFMDKRSCGYWRGTYNAKTNELDIGLVKNETQLRHFAAANNMWIGDYIPEWDLTFDPHDYVRVDVTNRSVNLFQPTKYMLATPKSKPIKAVPPTIKKVIHHALGSDDVCYERFINHIAYIAQTHCMTRTAWVLHGTEGTGKGLLFHQILAKLFGQDQTVMRTMAALDETYNDYMEKCLIVMIDEVQTSTMRNSKGIMAKLRNFITEPTIGIRAMYRVAYNATNFANLFFLSNQPDPVSIPKEDRRFSVGKYQPNKLIINEKEIHELLPAELQDFYQFLIEYQVNLNDVHTPLQNEDRAILMSISENSIDGVTDALLKGDFEFFMDQLPTTQIQDNFSREIVENYKATLVTITDRTVNHEETMKGKCNVSRDELFAIFQYTVGDMPRATKRFSARLKHHRIHLGPVRINNKVVQGIGVDWTNLKAMGQHRAVLVGKPTLKLVAKAGKKK